MKPVYYNVALQGCGRRHIGLINSLFFQYIQWTWYDGFSEMAV